MPVIHTLVKASIRDHTEAMRRRLGITIALMSVLMLPSVWAQSESGLAGSYNTTFEGKTTSSGEKYDPNALTAGAPDIRLGMRLAVTNPATGRTITVRVNDNRSLEGGRILELSQAAARSLGLSESQTATVEIHALRVDEPDITRLPPIPAPTPPTPPTPAPTPVVSASLPPPPETYFQMGAFRTEINAQVLAQKLTRRGDHPQIYQSESLYRVYLIVKDSEASALIEKLTKDRVGFFQVSKEPSGTSVKLSTE